MSLVRIADDIIAHSPSPNPDMVFNHADYSDEVWNQLLALANKEEVDVTNTEDETLLNIIAQIQKDGIYTREYSEKNAKGGERIDRELWTSEVGAVIVSRTYPKDLTAKDFNANPKIKTSLIYG